MAIQLLKTRMLGLVLSLCLGVPCVALAETSKKDQTRGQAMPTNATGSPSQITQDKAAFQFVQFVQFASEASIEKISGHGKDATYRLVLKKINPQVTFYAERPARKTGLMPTEKYVEHWNRSGGNSFRENGPNAFLHATEGNTTNNGNELKHVNIAIELSNPSFDAKTQTFSYTVKLLQGSAVDKMPADIRHVTLFIDDDVCLSCW